MTTGVINAKILPVPFLFQLDNEPFFFQSFKLTFPFPLEINNPRRTCFPCCIHNVQLFQLCLQNWEKLISFSPGNIQVLEMDGRWQKKAQGRGWAANTTFPVHGALFEPFQRGQRGISALAELPAQQRARTGGNGLRLQQGRFGFDIGENGFCYCNSSVNIFPTTDFSFPFLALRWLFIPSTRCGNFPPFLPRVPALESPGPQDQEHSDRNIFTPLFLR